jgi:hypothetical protein
MLGEELRVAAGGILAFVIAWGRLEHLSEESCRVVVPLACLPVRPRRHDREAFALPCLLHGIEWTPRSRGRSSREH